MGKVKNHPYKVSSVKVEMSSKDKTEHNRNPENAPDYEQKTVEMMNTLNNSNDTKFSDLVKSGVVKTVQVPTDILGNNGEPVGKMINQAIYYVANNDVKSARNCLKSVGMSGLKAKIFCKDEIQLQKRHPEEVAKYKGKPMPEEFKLPTERLN
jgi:hypothetical protein